MAVALRHFIPHLKVRVDNLGPVGGVIVGELAAVAGAVAVAAAMWVFMFRLDRYNVWPRTWVAAAVMSGYAIAATLALGDTRDLVGRVSAVEMLIGAAAGTAWLLVTQLGAAALARVVPSFAAQTSDLYRLAGSDRAARIAGPLIAMAAAEELLFRGFIQARAGLVVAVMTYAAVQVVERKWILVLAAALGGLVWGGLFAWRHGLVAPAVAHVVWTFSLALVWPIRQHTRGTQPHEARQRARGRHPDAERVRREP